MELIKWQPSFRTDIASIDNQTRELIKNINIFLSMIDEDADGERIIDKLGCIYSLMSATFSLEEDLMQTRDYIYYHEHKNDHEFLLNDIYKVAEEYSNTAHLNSLRLEKKLNEWFVIHSGSHDSHMFSDEKIRERVDVNSGLFKDLVHNAKSNFLGKIAI